MSRPEAPDKALQPGRVLDGRYRIEGVIGGGGMARVYRAEHLLIARPVAIKVLHEGHRNNGDAIVRFQREATTSGRLVHPNIVTVTDSGTLEDGRCFLVMEALDGETLADRLEREDRIPWQAAVALLGEILLGLRHAHDRGVVHRDVKPENIFLVRGDVGPRLKILDFGIAKLCEDATEDGRITRDGLTIGTPIYMSPEQAVDGEITPASDLYSATVVLFEMVTGEPPFYRDDAIALMKAHVHAPPPTLREHAPDLDLPDTLEAIVRRGLAKLAVDRIPSADAYLRMLEPLKVAEISQLRDVRTDATPPAGEIIPADSLAQLLPLLPLHATQPPLRVGDRDTLVEATPPTVETRAHGRGGRRLLAGGLLLAAAMIPAAYHALRSPAGEVPDASPPPAVAASEPAPAGAASGFAPAPVAIPEPRPAARAGGDPQPARAVRRPSPAPAPAAEVAPPRDREPLQRWLAEGTAALAAGRLDEAGAQFRRAIAANAAAHAAHAGLAEVAYNRGDFPRAMLAARRAVSLAPGIAAYRMILAKAHYKLLRYDDAIAQWQKALELEPGNERARKNIELARAKRGGGGLTSAAATGSPR